MASSEFPVFTVHGLGHTHQQVSSQEEWCHQREAKRVVGREGAWCNWGGQGKLSRNGTPNGIPTHMHNSRVSTRRLSRAMPSGCTSLPESPAARCSVCRAKRIFRHASSSSGRCIRPSKTPAGACLPRQAQPKNQLKTLLSEQA